MKVTPTELPGVLLIEPRVFGDARGFFFESWNEQEFERAGIRVRFVQDNHSRSGRGVLRGLHYQIRQPQGKLVRVVAGEIFDVAADIRRSKLAGERAIHDIGGAHLILRTSWVYSARGENFLLTIRRLLREKKELRVVSDQVGAPTSARGLAEATAELLRRHGAAALGDARGIYHATTSGSTSWHGFAREIARLERSDSPARIVPIASSDYPAPARRPRNSCLSNEKLHRRFGVALPRWEASLEACHAMLAKSAELKPDDHDAR